MGAARVLDGPALPFAKRCRVTWVGVLTPWRGPWNSEGRGRCPGGRAFWKVENPCWSWI